MHSIEILIISFILIMPIFALASTIIEFNFSPGSGTKVGQIVKISRVGLMHKTWEGEIIRGGFTTGSGTMGAKFDFTIEQDALAEKVSEFLAKQTEVTITYRQELVYLKWRTESHGHFLISIEPTK